MKQITGTQEGDTPLASSVPRTGLSSYDFKCQHKLFTDDPGKSAVEFYSVEKDKTVSQKDIVCNPGNWNHGCLQRSCDAIGTITRKDILWQLPKIRVGVLEAIIYQSYSNSTHSLEIQCTLCEFD